MNNNLSQKETMLLQDQKSQEQICIEKYSVYAQQAQDSTLKQLFQQIEQTEREHLNSIDQLLNGQIPQMGGQQSQQMTQPKQANSQQMNNQFPHLTEKDMCSDLLATEKFTSSTYDTAIFEFRNPQIRSVLNHIQKEEQEHGQQLFQYMQSHGMYNVQ